MKNLPMTCRTATLALLALLCAGPGVHAAPGASDDKPAAAKDAPKAELDRSGKPRKGKASYYGKKFAGKKMADGTPMNPESNVAASKTLPLGTKAKVTNLETGKSEEVEIRDRGPYVEGRIVDVTPKTAEQLGIKEQGVAPVEVRPIEIPPPKSSAGASSGR